MDRPSRRQFTGALGSAVAVGLSGCTEAFGEYLGNDQTGELLVVTTNLRAKKSPGGETTYPTDIEARIVIENRRSERQNATLEATLRHDPPDGPAESWTETRELKLGRGVSPTILILYRSVFEASDNFDSFEIDAQILEPDEKPAQ